MFFIVNFKFGYRRRLRSFGIPDKTLNLGRRVQSFGISIKVKTFRIKLLYGANDHFKNSIESS